MSNDPPEKYPYRKSEAANMLAAAIARSKMTQREIAYKLGYRSSVPLSHMASGRIPIPKDRIRGLVETLDFDAKDFALSVIKQANPYLFRILEREFNQKDNDAQFRDHIIDDLETVAGRPLNDFSPSQLKVMREIASDQSANNRWLSVHELSTMELIRSLRPEIETDGLAREDMDALAVALKNRLAN